MLGAFLTVVAISARGVEGQTVPGAGGIAHLEYKRVNSEPPHPAFLGSRPLTDRDNQPCCHYPRF
jgi:hypothetical protein